MKITLELPEPLFRRARSFAAEQGISLPELISDALAEKLRVAGDENKPWLKSFGKLRGLRSETARVNAIIKEEFAHIYPRTAVDPGHHGVVGDC